MQLIIEVVEDDPRRFVLRGPNATVGRAPDCEIVFDEPRVSRVHGRFVWRADGIDYLDLSSRNGSGLRRAEADTWRAVQPGVPARLHDGDTLVLATLTDPLKLRVVVVSDGVVPHAQPQTMLADAPLVRLLREPTSTWRQLLLSAMDADDWSALAAAFLVWLDRTLPDTRAAGGVLMGAAGRHAFGVAIEGQGTGVHPHPDGALLRLPIQAGRTAHGWCWLTAAGFAPDAVESVRAATLILGMAATALSTRLAGAAQRAVLAARIDALEGARPGQGPTPLGDSPGMRTAVKLGRRLAPTPLSLVITGETGTGKEVISRAIHRWSRRHERPFVAINCAAIPDQLLESALFGHQRGAFTGAHRDHVGVFEQANGGTLFLDEIGEMPLPMQAKLLRVLENGQVRRVGDQVDRTVDVRIVCATHRNLETLVDEGAFRADLRYRLDGATIELPPLRAREDDLLVLAHHFLRMACVAQSRRVPGFSTAALACLAAYPFPGNLRELRNEIARALALTDDGQAIEPQAFSDRLHARPAAPIDGTLKAQVMATERRAAQAALAAHDGQVSAAARSLGLSRAGLYKLLARVGLSG